MPPCWSRSSDDWDRWHIRCRLAPGLALDLGGYSTTREPGQTGTMNIHVTLQRRWPPKKRPKCPTCFDFSHVCLVAPTRSISLISIVSPADLTLKINSKLYCLSSWIRKVSMCNCTHCRASLSYWNHSLTITDRYRAARQMNNKNDFLVAQQFHKNDFEW